MFLSKIEFQSILVARHVCILLQNIANTLFDTIGEIIGPLLYFFRFKVILKSWLLSQKCHQRERTSLRDGLWLPSKRILKIMSTSICNEA